MYTAYENDGTVTVTAEVHEGLLPDNIRILVFYRVFYNDVITGIATYVLHNASCITSLYGALIATLMKLMPL